MKNDALTRYCQIFADLTRQHEYMMNQFQATADSQEQEGYNEQMIDLESKIKSVRQKIIYLAKNS